MKIVRFKKNERLIFWHSSPEALADWKRRKRHSHDGRRRIKSKPKLSELVQAASARRRAQANGLRRYRDSQAGRLRHRIETRARVLPDRLQKQVTHLAENH